MVRIVCGICRTVQRPAEGPGVDQPICAPCLRASRVRSGVLPAPVPPPVDFDLLPFAAHVRFGEVPMWPLDEHFHLAGSDVADSEADPAASLAAQWRLEAVRWRRHHGGQPLDLAAIRTALEARLAQVDRADAWRWALAIV